MWHLEFQTGLVIFHSLSKLSSALSGSFLLSVNVSNEGCECIGPVSSWYHGKVCIAVALLPSSLSVCLLRHVPVMYVCDMLNIKEL